MDMLDPDDLALSQQRDALVSRTLAVLTTDEAKEVVHKLMSDEVTTDEEESKNDEEIIELLERVPENPDGVVLDAFAAQMKDLYARSIEHHSKGRLSLKKRTVNFAQGQGTISDTNFQFEAIGTDPTTDAARGALAFTNPDGIVKASISCLRVSGGAGFFVATVTESSNPDIPVGGVFGINMYDSGQPNGAGDRVLGRLLSSGVCQNPTVSGDLIDSGDIVVGTEAVSDGSGSEHYHKGHHHRKHHKGGGVRQSV